MDSNKIDHLRLESTQSTDSAGTLTASPQGSTFSNPLLSPKNGHDGSIPSYIPAEHDNRTLVVCFDGTGDQFDTDNSNIVEFFSLLKKDDPSKQMVYYQAGIGTYTIPQIATPFFAKVSKLVDEAIAWDLDAHIMGGYEFLMQNYAAKDKICIFGFSRGAYTARCLAGMIHKVGLLPTCNYQQIPFAYKMYTRADDKGWEQSNAFKKTFSIDVDVHFLGVWDTVNSVGLFPRRLPFTASNSVVGTFRHAISLDERRAKFKANTWNRPLPEEVSLGITEKKIAKAQEAHKKGKSGDNHRLRILEIKYGKHRMDETNVDEVWFAGCHCDVGGGSVNNKVKPCTARIPLRWMIRECFRTKSGIMFLTEDMKRTTGLDPASLYPIVRDRPPAITIDSISQPLFIEEIPKVPKPPMDELADEEEVHETEEEADLHDSLAPIYDQLSLRWLWWILELVPLRHRFQASHDNKWYWSWVWNFGRGRHIPRQPSDGVRVHRSVKTRMDAEYKDGSKYWPKANLDLKHVTWVD